MLEINTIHVIDASGNRYHDTYPKRARGLVRKGKAYPVSPDTICLNSFITPNEEVLPMEDTKTTAADNTEEITVSYLLSKIDAIHQDTAYLHTAFGLLEKIPYNISKEDASVRTEAIIKVVSAREETNQQMIQLLERIYDDFEIIEED